MAANNPSENGKIPTAAPRHWPPSRSLGQSRYTIHRAVAELQDHHQSVQKRTFTRWMNSHLSRWRPPMKIEELFEDIKDGSKLIALLQILSGERLTTEPSRKSKRVGHLANIQTAIQLLESKKIKLVNINPADVVDGKPSIVLGLLWSIILYFQIEELTSNLPFAGELSTSTSSLDSLSSGPQQKRRTGAKSKWKGAAKKALLQWVRKKTANNPDGFNVAVKDFGPSWRDGKAFNNMIYTIRPELVDFEKVAQNTNRENLEHAFDTAERHLGIPRLLEPEDVDVDRPDEKSVMTYVAQFVKEFSGIGDEKDETPQVDEDVLQYEEIMEWLHDAETTLADVHKRFRYRNQDYADRQEFKKDFNKFDDRAHLLRDKWISGEASSISEPQMEEMNQLLEKVDKSGKKWHRELDSRLPGQLGEVGAWLHVAEGLLSQNYEADPNQEDSANAIKKQIDEHRSIFKNKKIMEQMFQRSKNTRTSRMGQQPAIPREQLDDFGQRLSRINSESASRMAQLEFLDAKGQSTNVLSAAQSMVRPWTVKLGKMDSVDDLLQSYQETVMKPNLIEKFQFVGDRLLSTGTAYLESGIPPEEKEQIENFLEEHTSQISDACARLQDVQSTLEKASRRWVQYDQSLARFEPWLNKAEEVIKTKGINGKDFFENLPEYEQIHHNLNECGRFLTEVCNQKIADEIKHKMAALNGRWKKVHAACKGYMREEELSKMREEFQIGVNGLQDWLETVEAAVLQELPFEQQAVKDYLRDMEEIRDEMHQAEDKYKLVSKMAQGLVKDTPQDRVNNMLVTMTKIKDRLLKARGDVSTSISNCDQILGPLQDFVQDMDAVNSFVDEARSLSDEYGNSDKDVETLYQKHQQCFAKSKPIQDKLTKIGQALEKFKRHPLPGMGLAELQDEVTEVSANFQLSMKQGNDWKPKLKAGTESARDYKKHLGAIQRWLKHADKLLEKPFDQELPQKLMKEHQEFFGDVDSSLLSSFMNVSKKCQSSQISDSQSSKVKEMTNQVQHEYSSALKRSTHRLLKLKFLEAEEELSNLISSCNKILKDEEKQLDKKTKTNEEILAKHKKTFDDAFLKLDAVQNTMESLCENLREAVPNDYSWVQKMTEWRERFENIVAAEQEIYLKLTELPEKWEEFSRKIEETIKWVREAEAVMETIHNRVEPDQDKFNAIAARFKKMADVQDDHQKALEYLSSSLADLAKHSPQEQIDKNSETLMKLKSSTKSVINALPITERRVESVRNCLQYKDNIQESNSELDREIEKLEALSVDGNMKPVDSLEEALKVLDEFQEEMSSLDSLSTKVTDEIGLGEELHSDEQSPSFLYSEVSGLRTRWEKLQDVAALKEKEIMETVQLWQEHENILSQINNFLEQIIPALGTRLRLSNMNGINQEIAAKDTLKDQVDHAVKGMELAFANMEQLKPRTSKEGMKRLQEEHENINGKLQEVKDALEAGIAQVRAIKQEWMKCDQEMDKISEWTDKLQSKGYEVEKSQESPENQFTAAQELIGVLQAKSHELVDLEERLNKIEGLESPTTLHAKLANVRNQWEQTLRQAQLLATSIGENISHQEKFDSTAQQVEESLEAAKQEMEKEIQPCVSSDEVQDRKDDLLKFSHTLEKVKLGLTTLQSEVKLLKDASDAKARKQTLQHKYSDITNLIRVRSHNFDDAISKWHQYEKKLFAVKQYIDRCEEIASADNSALPGDPQKLHLELQTAEKLLNEIPTNRNALQELREFIDEIDKVSPVDIEPVLLEINEMDAMISNYPQKIADRQRIVNAALASHMQYNETVDGFTSWLMSFEKILRSTTDVYLAEVPLAVDVIKVCTCCIRL